MVSRSSLNVLIRDNASVSVALVVSFVLQACFIGIGKTFDRVRLAGCLIHPIGFFSGCLL